MDASMISGLSGLAGAAIGGLASFSTTWLTTHAQSRERQREMERTQREQLFNAFITEASRLYGDALGHQKDDPGDLVQLYALTARMRLLVSRPVVTAAEHAMEVIVETYLKPNRTLREMRELAQTGDMDFLSDFAEACRLELTGRLGPPSAQNRPAG